MLVPRSLQEALDRVKKGNEESGAEMRQQKQLRDQQKKRQEESKLAELRARSQSARKLDGLLDAREAEQDAQERAEGTAARLACAQAQKEVRKRETEWKTDKARLARAQADEARAARQQAAGGHSKYSHSKYSHSKYSHSKYSHSKYSHRKYSPSK